jgi:hypothetical protein
VEVEVVEVVDASVAPETNTPTPPLAPTQTVAPTPTPSLPSDCRLICTSHLSASDTSSDTSYAMTS